MGVRFLELSTWERAAHYQAFRNSAQPQYCVTFPLDITNFLARVKEKRVSFTFAFVYAVSFCANQIEEFRCRFVDGKPAVFDEINTSFTYLKPGAELFSVINVPMQKSMEAYLDAATSAVEAQETYFTAPMGNDIFQFSSFPWVSYTHISHTWNGNPDNATPLFDWGKFYEENGKTLLPLSVQVHHSFVDGLHIGRLADSLQRYLDEFRWERG